MSDFCEVCECDPCDCHGQTEEEIAMTYEYIHDESKNWYYVPRAPSLCEARTRSSIFQKHFGDEPLIVTPMVWEMMKSEHGVKYLEE